MFGTSVDDAVRAHALTAFPLECCGVVDAVGQYHPLPNISDQPLDNFRLPADALIRSPAVVGIVHSHIAPRHLPWPTDADMRGQIASALPWGVCLTDGETASDPLWWGDAVLDEPMLGRPFVPGIRDCYALVRAWYWQERNIKLPEFPRGHNWWAAGENLLLDGYAAAGFAPVPAADAQNGDMVFMNIRSVVPNHCGIVLDDGLVLHHLGNRLSRREPIGPWRPFISHTMRHS